ncbi:MAG: acyl carrier protein [Clostridiales bacterium]|jgi:acyl carrier protein|nr:acyl carrier protein [Clostridiales bacterium]
MGDGSDSKRREKITEDVIALLKESMNISPVDLKASTNLVEELAIDSMQLYEFVVDLEEAYNIRLPDELLEQIVTVDDIVDLVVRLTSE